MTQNVPIKYAVDSISLPNTQQAAYDLLSQGGKLVIFLPPAAKMTKEKEIVPVAGFLRSPPNIKLLETFYHDNFERLLKEGAIKVSYSLKCPSVYFHFWLIVYGSQTKLKYCLTALREYRKG